MRKIKNKLIRITQRREAKEEETSEKEMRMKPTRLSTSAHAQYIHAHIRVGDIRMRKIT